MKRKRIISTVCCIGLVLSGCSLQPANRSYKKAVSAYQQGDYDKAESHFLSAIDSNPEKAEYYLDYGFTLIQKGETGEAVNQFERVIMEDTTISMVIENNKRAYRGMGIAYLKNNEYDKALEAFEAALAIEKLADMDEDILYYKGLTLEYAGRLKEAVDIYSELLANNDKDASLYGTRANLYRKLNEYELSIADYDKALQYQEGNFELYFGKFSALKELGKEQEAMETLDLAARITISTEEDKFSLAKVHFYQGNYESSAVEFQNALSNGFTEANYFLAEMSLASGQYEEAIKYYLAYENSGNQLSAMFYNQLLVCYLNQEDYESAADCLKKAKSFSTVSVAKQLLRNEIILLEKTGDFTGAYEKMERYKKLYDMDEETSKDYEFLKNRVEALNSDSSASVSTTEDENTTVVKP